MIDQIAYYNVDGNNDLCRPKDGEPDRDGLARAERIELLTNRCFVKAMQPHDDLWPYDDAYHAPLWEPSQDSAS